MRTAATLAAAAVLAAVAAVLAADRHLRDR